MCILWHLFKCSAHFNVHALGVAWNASLQCITHAGIVVNCSVLAVPPGDLVCFCTYARARRANM